MEKTVKNSTEPKPGSNLKRPRRPEQWKQNRLKSSRVSGESYEARNGTIVGEKRFRAIDKCCNFECAKKVDTSSQQYLFEDFWKRGKSKQIQDLNLASCLRWTAVKRRRTNAINRNRQNQWQYFIRLGAADVRVCRKFVANLYQVSEKRLRIIQLKITRGETSFQENRGRHTNRPHRTPENALLLMKEHFTSASQSDSFYITSKKGGSRLDYQKLYDSFSQYYEGRTQTALSISSRMYKTLFRKNTEFMLSPNTANVYLSDESVEVVALPMDDSLIFNGGLNDGVSANGLLDGNHPHQQSSLFAHRSFDESCNDQQTSLLDDSHQLALLSDGSLHERHLNQHPSLLAEVLQNGSNRSSGADRSLDQNYYYQQQPSSSVAAVEYPPLEETSDHHNPSLAADERWDPLKAHENGCSTLLQNGLPDSGEINDENTPTEVQFQPMNSCCVQKCYQKFEASSQKYLFAEYRNLGKSKQIQDLYLASCLKKIDVKTHLTDAKKLQRQRWHVFLKVGSVNVRVCLSFLKNLYQVSDKRIRVIQSRILRGDTSFLETRGRGKKNPRSLPPKVVPLMKDHLSSIPHYESSSPARCKYFENPDLNLKRIYKAFCEYYKENTGNTLTLKFAKYSELFHIHSEIKLSPPDANYCDTCASFKSSVSLMENVPTAQMAHEDFRNMHIELRNRLLTEAKKGEILMIEFDYIPNICVPRLNSTQEIYQQLTWVHGFNVHNHCDDSSYMYLFPESKAVKNADSVISFIYATIQPILESQHSYRRVVLLSNDCDGQNKHMSVVQFCTWMSVIHQIPFQQIFPVEGHSSNICSQNYDLFRLKNQKRTRLIDVKPILEDMVSARTHPSPFLVSYDLAIMDRWTEAFTGYFSAQPKNDNRRKFFIQSYMQLKYIGGKVYGNTTYYDNSELWVEFTYILKHIDIRNITLRSSIPPGVDPAKRKNVFSLFCFLTSEEIIKFQESFSV
ncbi:uncharacterized protein LOC135832963 isoform X1 [Planococcus citri]|uniref:uncharacterized protein LOC135832963 isoform X1 n=1 Tax=Planococcus citri TaxID=170843 RepID=UPI0031F9D475